MQIFTNNSTFMLERSMDFLWTKQTAILDNIANVETPDYKTKYVTFEEALDEKLKASNSKSPKRAVKMRDALENTTAVIHEADEQLKADGNGVDINEQSIELARNAFQQQHIYNALNKEFALLRAVVTN